MSGDLTVDANWTGGVAPGVTDTARIDGTDTILKLFSIGADWIVATNSWYNISGGLFDLGGHTASASLPEKAHLKYDSVSKTLGVVMPPHLGTFLYVR